MHPTMMASFPLTRWRRPAKLFRAEHGASAIEFALLAPVLIPAFLAMVEIGQALTEQINMGSFLRAGAQSAIAGGDDADIRQILLAINDDTSVMLDVERICACAEDPKDPVDCSTTCPGAAPTNIYYLLRAEKPFSGMFLNTTLTSELSVQVR